MDMKTRSHWAHGCPPAIKRGFSWPPDTTALAAAMRAAALPPPPSVCKSSASMATASPSESVETMCSPIVVSAGLSRSSASTAAASFSSSSPLVRLSEGSVRGTSLTSCYKTKRRSLRFSVNFVPVHSLEYVFLALMHNLTMALEGQRVTLCLYGPKLMPTQLSGNKKQCYIKSHLII